MKVTIPADGFINYNLLPGMELRTKLQKDPDAIDPDNAPLIIWTEIYDAQGIHVGSIHPSGRSDQGVLISNQEMRMQRLDLPHTSDARPSIITLIRTWREQARARLGLLPGQPVPQGQEHLVPGLRELKTKAEAWLRDYDAVNAPHGSGFIGGTEVK